MSFEVFINGKPFTLWESASVTRDIDSNAGVFRFTNSSTMTAFSDYPLDVGDLIEIVIDCIQKVLGFIDEFVEDEDDGAHIISISGRDNIQDLIDSSVPDSAKVTEGPVTLKKLCETVISAIGATITVIENVTGLEAFTSEDLQSAGSGEKCMEYLVSFARKRQVYLVPDGLGNLLIYRPDTSNKASGALINKRNGATNNVKSSTIKRSQQHRFNKILCRSQDNFGFDPLADYEDEGTDRKAEVTDSAIRATRYLEIQAEESMTDAECLERASEESNIRRAKGLEYMPIVAGVTQPDGTIWDFGQFVQVDDEVKGVTGEFLVKAVEYMVDVVQGTRTKLTVVPPDAYQVIAETSKETARKSTI